MLARTMVSLGRWATRLPAPLRRLLRLVAGALADRSAPGAEDWSMALVGGGTVADLRQLSRVAPPLSEPAAGVPGLRVVVLTSVLDVGGLDEFVALLSRGLAARGAVVEIVIALDPVGWAGRLAETLTGEGFTVRTASRSTLGELLASAEPDVVSIHDAPGWAVAEVARLGVPQIEVLHGAGATFDADPAVLAQRVARLDGVVAVSELVRRQFLALAPGFAPERAWTIPNGAWSRAQPPVVRDQARAALRLEDEFLFVSLARHALQKNGYGLVAAFDEVAAARPEAHLVIAGRVDSRRYFAQVATLAQASAFADRIHLRDHTPDPVALMAAADCFVLDSFFEGWSLATTEAMTSGLPVVLSDVAGAREQLTVPAGGEPVGILVGNPGGDLEVSWETVSASRFRRQPNHDELVAALTRMVVERDVWAARRDRMAAEASQRFDPQRCLDRHAELLQQAATAARATG